MTISCKQCPSMTVTLCLKPHFVWILAGRVFKEYLREVLTERGFLSRPPQRGRSVVMSKRNFATLLLTTTKSSNRLRNVPTIRSTCSQTETSSQSVLNVSITLKNRSSQVSLATKPAECTTSSFQNVNKCDAEIRVNFYANVVLSSSTTMLQEIGECLTKATDNVGSIHDVPSSASNC